MKKIKSIEIKNSSFFKDNFKILFDEKLNCIMGGRGTGKTTILYFIMAAIREGIDENKFAHNILKNNLGEGEIILEVENEQEDIYKISKYTGDEPQPIKINTGDFIHIKKIENSIMCDIYEASAIEEIGRNSEERLKLINKMLPTESFSLNEELEKIKIDLSDNADDILTLTQKLLYKESIIKSLENIPNELLTFKKNAPIDIDPEEDERFNEANLNENIRINEQMFFNKTEELFKRIDAKLLNIVDDLTDFIANNSFKIENTFNKGEMEAALKLLNEITIKVKNYIGLSKTHLDKATLNLKEVNDKISEKHIIQQSEFIKLKQKILLHKEYYNKLNELTKKENDRVNLEKDYKEDKTKIEKLFTSRKILLENYNRKKQQIFDIRIEKINELNRQFNEQIKISIRIGGITNEYENKLKDTLKGTGLRYNELVPKICTIYNPVELAEKIHKEDVTGLSNALNIDTTRVQTLVNKLKNTKDIFDIEAIYCQDLPDFYLKIDKGAKLDYENYQKSDELSTGQRCTTVLPIIFAVSSNPLIIDQPEDNLDNKYITNTIYKIIKEQKQNRQLIFITHNPNIPVLSDAENNIFLKYNQGSVVDKVGDVETVKDRILELLEGGKEAFETRKKLYENKLVENEK